MAVPPQVAPQAGFTAKLTAHGTKYYVNICAHPAIDRPIDAQDRPVSDDHLDSMGVDNLRVPLLTGPARVIGEDESCCMDVVFHPAVLRISLPPEPQADDGPQQKRRQALGQHVRQRLVELALKNVEEDLDVKLGRDYTLPRNIKYKGGVGPEKRPVPLAVLRQMVAGKAAEAAHKELAAAPGPWRTNHKKVGLERREAPRIVELEEEGSVLDAATKQVPAAGVKKGFLNSAKAQGALYPNGSTEGTPADGAGDPLGWMPKGLRSKVQVVDESMTPEQQRAMMEKAAKGELRQTRQAPAATGGAQAGGGAGMSGTGGVSGMKGGFLSGKGGALAAEADGKAQAGTAQGSKAQGGGKSDPEIELLRQLMPSEEEVRELTANTGARHLTTPPPPPPPPPPPRLLLRPALPALTRARRSCGPQTPRRS